jgi:crotonobetainyl-CoA:carnitine CoA-transferase CaiB-like acyl-CoA transferase
VRWADVYITNQLPRVRRKLNTEPADLFALNPKLVFAKGHGQGQRGTDAEMGGFDAVSFWARGGLAHVLTSADADQPTPQRPAQGDVPTGMFFAGGICAAIVHATRTGQGIVVDASLLNGATWTLSPDMAYASLANAQLPMGSGGPPSPITQTYKTADARFVTLMMIDEARYWDQACRALRLDDLIASHPDPASRLQDRLALTERVREAVAAMTKAELEKRLRAEDGIYSVMATPPEVVQDQAVVDNGYLMPHPTHPTLRLAAAPAQFDDELPAIRRGAPDLGQHSREILEQLGYQRDEIQQLLESGTVIESAASPAQGQ